jgi:hypothetical protein
MDVSEYRLHIREIGKVEFHMSRGFCGGILYPWSYSLYEMMFEYELGIFIDLASRDIEQLRYLVSLKQIPDIHRYGTKIGVKCLIFFFVQFLFYNCSFFIKISINTGISEEMRRKSSVGEVYVSMFIEIMDIYISCEDIANLDISILMFQVFA